jgi:hypothetical protein
MTYPITRLAAAALLAASLASPALAQGAKQTVSLMQVDPATLATGFRTSKVVGSTVVNEGDVPVGTIDDLIVTPNEKVPFGRSAASSASERNMSWCRSARCRYRTARSCSRAPPRPR